CRDLPFVEYAREFCRLPTMSALDDTTQNPLSRVESRTSPPAHPEPSQPSPRRVEPEPEPTLDGEPEPESDRAIAEGSDSTVDRYGGPSNQVRELATWPATVDVPVGPPLLTLSPPSVRWVRRGSASLRRHHGWRIPRLRLQPLSPGLRLGPPTQRLHPGSQLPRLHRRLSAADLRISVSSSVARALGSALALRILGVAQDHRLSASGSTSACSACSAPVIRPPGVVCPSSTMAPPSLSSHY
ncbi:hypothetical protein M9458_053830, partial [Cirrhinus mrigala]